MLVADFAARWNADWPAATLAHRTLRDYAWVYNRHLLARVGDLQLRHVTPAVVTGYAADP